MITKPYLAGSYFATLCIENQYFCVDSLELIIQIKGDEVFYIPNTLTPDGDEYNHYFEPISTAGCDPDNFQMEIYNRWGESWFINLLIPLRDGMAISMVLLVQLEHILGK
jgi:hypothetical protein